MDSSRCCPSASLSPKASFSNASSWHTVETLFVRKEYRQCPRIDAFVCTCSLTRVAQFAKRFKLLERPYSPINIDARAICQASKNNDAPASVLLVPDCLPPPLSHPWHYCLRRLLLPRSTRTFQEPITETLPHTSQAPRRQTVVLRPLPPRTDIEHKRDA